MELRHLRCFLALAEELHFGRAAERLHIEQSPLSRAIKELEEELGVLLFKRNRRGTHLTHVGQVFRHDVSRIFGCLEQASVNVRAAASGYRGSLSIAVSEGAAGPRLASLLASCREAEPETVIHLCDVPRDEQLRGLRDGSFDAGFAHSKDVGTDIETRPVWADPLVVAIPPRHPLLAYPQVPLTELLHHPLLLCHPCRCEGYAQQIARVLSTVETEPMVAERIASLDMMLTLVAAGFGVGFSTASVIAMCNHPNVIMRPLDVPGAVLTTYLSWPAGEMVDTLARFLERSLAAGI